MGAQRIGRNLSLETPLCQVFLHYKFVMLMNKIFLVFLSEICDNKFMEKSYELYKLIGPHGGRTCYAPGTGPKELPYTPNREEARRMALQAALEKINKAYCISA